MDASAGFVIGLGSGIAVGVATGAYAGEREKRQMKKKIKRFLEQEQITIHAKSGESTEIDKFIKSLFEYKSGK